MTPEPARNGPPTEISRDRAIAILKPYVGIDLRPIAEKFGVTVWKNGHKNKGWAGMTVEQMLGHPQDAAQAPDFGTWELKVVPVVRNAQGHWQVKETMAITMIDPKNVAETPFEHSHLLDKLRAMLVCAREWKNDHDEESRLVKLGTFDLADGDTFRQVQADYELVQKTIRAEGAKALTGWMGNLVQPRTKGPGHGVHTHAFYARTSFVSRMLKLADEDGIR
ncbi:MAG: MutH/Sau3AI family endonuclease [Verrucomicrobia bacterium]|nr:MutH/Sau3AI family endonuclease [Verrucomicrobiota bacterium]